MSLNEKQDLPYLDEIIREVLQLLPAYEVGCKIT